MHFELKVNSDVVGTSAVNPSPSYDGIYVVLEMRLFKMNSLD